MTNTTLTAATPQAPDTLAYEPTCPCKLCEDARAALLALELGMLPAATSQPKAETIAIDPAAVATLVGSAEHYGFNRGWRLAPESIEAFRLDDRPADREYDMPLDWEPPWGPDEEDERWAIDTRPEWAAVGCGEWDLSPEEEAMEVGTEPAWEAFNRWADEAEEERMMERRLGW
jgi:hypothetical protein